MKVFKISQNDVNGYDTFDSAVVIAENKKEARQIHPYNKIGSDWNIYYDKKLKQFWNKRTDGSIYEFGDGGWTYNISKIKVEYIGETKLKTKGVICSSFNAG
jgi:hypothetical protein